MPTYFTTFAEAFETMYQVITTRIAFRIARCTISPIKDCIIQQFLRHYPIDMREAAESDPHSYPSFNALFTRALHANARKKNADPLAFISPVDGTISQIGSIVEHTLLQAKGKHYTLAALLGNTESNAIYQGGRFATIYLAPSDYHRIHMPFTGQLIRMDYIPGRLFSVRPQKIATVDQIFARNERLVCHFIGKRGPFALILVGAQLVSGLETIWHGPIQHRKAHTWHYNKRPIILHRQQEMGRFNFGSTVIMLTPTSLDWHKQHIAGQKVQLGNTLGTYQHEDNNGIQ